MNPQRLIGGLSRWIAPAVAASALVVGATVGLGPALLVLAGGTLVAVVLLLWSSIGRLTGESPLTLEEAIGLGAPSPEEERKRSILRALKDLEYERSVGKISDEDFADLSARYRADAKALLRLIEAESAPLRRGAEERLTERLKAERVVVDARSPKAGAGSRTEASPSVPSAPSPADAAEGARTDQPVCSSCNTANDVDASFCKRCGMSLHSAAGAAS